LGTPEAPKEPVSEAGLKKQKKELETLKEQSGLAKANVTEKDLQAIFEAPQLSQNESIEQLSALDSLTYEQGVKLFRAKAQSLIKLAPEDFYSEPFKDYLGAIRLQSKTKSVTNAIYLVQSNQQARDFSEYSTRGSLTKVKNAIGIKRIGVESGLLNFVKHQLLLYFSSTASRKFKILSLGCLRSTLNNWLVSKPPEGEVLSLEAFFEKLWNYISANRLEVRELLGLKTDVFQDIEKLKECREEKYLDSWEKEEIAKLKLVIAKKKGKLISNFLACYGFTTCRKSARKGGKVENVRAFDAERACITVGPAILKAREFAENTLRAKLNQLGREANMGKFKEILNDIKFYESSANLNLWDIGAPVNFYGILADPDSARPHLLDDGFLGAIISFFKLPSTIELVHSPQSFSWISLIHSGARITEPSLAKWVKENQQHF
jgi:hypothetical protein